MKAAKLWLYSPPYGSFYQAGGWGTGIPRASLSPGPGPGVARVFVGRKGAAGSRVTSFPFKRTSQGSSWILGRRRAVSAPTPRYNPGGGMGAWRHFAGAFTTKVAKNPFSRGRDNEQELKEIQVEKPVNARATHSWSQEVDTKLCGSLPRLQRVFS